MDAVNLTQTLKGNRYLRFGLAVFVMIFQGIVPAPCGLAQEAGEEDAVLKTVQKFFDSMTRRDVNAAKEVMLPDGQFYSVREGAGPFNLRRRTHREYFESVKEGTGEFVEKMRNPTVLIHGRIAVVWTPYDFHVSGKFSHCGVDAFTLIKMQDGWKIAGIAYTVEPEGCDPGRPGPVNKEKK